MSTPAGSKREEPGQLLLQLAFGHLVSAALYAVCKLGIPDLLRGGPDNTANLARLTGANEDAVYRAMRGLASKAGAQLDLAFDDVVADLPITQATRISKNLMLA